MNYIAPIQKKAQSRLSEIQILVGIAMKDREDWIRNKIRARWKLGKLPDGTFIGTYSTSQMGAEYAFFKNRINPLAGLGQVDLTLTGALGKGIKVSSFNDQTEIYSTDEKYEEITSKYGDYNFNITPEEEEELLSYIYDEINNKIINYVYG